MMAAMDQTAPALHTELVEISSLELDPANARLHDERNLDAIGYSLGRFKQVKNIVVHRPTRRVIAGNGTLTKALEGGATHIVVAWVDTVVEEDGSERPMTEEDAAELGILDNRTAELATWDHEQLAATIGEQPDLDWAAGGWETEDFEDFEVDWPLPEVTTVGEHERERGEAGEESLPEPPAEPVTQPGDLWILGDHRLMCGDSLDADARALLLDGEIADMVLMDPPFAIYGSSTGIGADIADDKMIRPFFRSLGFAVAQSVREFAHIYVCCDWRSWASIWAGMTGASLSPKNCLVWDKGDGGVGSNYQHCHEFVGFFEKSLQTTMTGREARGKKIVLGHPNILRHNRPTGAERLHNAAKPVAMFAELIENSSDEGDLVLDLFNGPGSVIIAGERTGRRVRAMEMEPRWCEVTAKRWEAETGQEAKLMRGGEVITHAFDHETPAEPARRTPARDGDKRQARRRVQTLIDNGTLPRPDAVTCVDCEDAPGREYDHHLGYGADHHEDVEALCAACHHKREADREAAKERAPT